MNELLEIEEIKKLKARYFRTLDTNQWEEFADTLTTDCVARYGGGKYSFDGRDAIVGFMSQQMSGEHFLSMHHGHHPEIELTGPGTARGIWYLQDVVIHLEQGWRLFGGGIYDDEYRKETDGRWRISRTAYERTFECTEPIPADQQVTANMFAGPR